MIDIKKLQLIGVQQLGKPYLFGAKWNLNDPDPKGPVDCSGFSRWLLYQLGIEIPEGSAAQFESSELLNPQSSASVGDLGFFKHPQGDVHHVGVIFDDLNVIEARGEPYNKVILRPREKWVAWSEFTGWHGLNES